MVAAETTRHFSHNLNAAPGPVRACIVGDFDGQWFRKVPWLVLLGSWGPTLAVNITSEHQRNYSRPNPVEQRPAQRPISQ
jgi:hypothetical protein